jgi:hypothetical protein
MKQKYIYDLIGKYLADEIDEKEKEIFESWLRKSEENAKEFALHQKAWQETQISFKSDDSETAFKNILGRIDDQHEQELRGKQKFATSSVKQYFIVFSKIAASLLLWFQSGTFFRNLIRSPKKSHLKCLLSRSKILQGKNQRYIFLMAPLFG